MQVVALLFAAFLRGRSIQFVALRQILFFGTFAELCLCSSFTVCGGCGGYSDLRILTVGADVCFFNFIFVQWYPCFWCFVSDETGARLGVGRVCRWIVECGLGLIRYEL